VLLGTPDPVVFEYEDEVVLALSGYKVMVGEFLGVQRQNKIGLKQANPRRCG